MLFEDFKELKAALAAKIPTYFSATIHPEAEGTVVVSRGVAAVGISVVRGDEDGPALFGLTDDGGNPLPGDDIIYYEEGPAQAARSAAELLHALVAEALEADRRRRRLGNRRGAPSPIRPAFAHFDFATPLSPTVGWVAAALVLDVPDRELEALLPRGLDGMWSSETRDACALLGADLKDLRLETPFAETARDWRCPSCGRGKAQIARGDGKRRAFIGVVIHHDHAANGGDQPERWPRFRDTAVCGDCNVAEASAKAELVKRGLAPRWFSFAPDEVAEFSSARPNVGHEVDHARAEEVFRRSEAIQDFLRREREGAWPVLDPEHRVHVAEGEVIPPRPDAAVGAFAGFAELTRRLGLEDPYELRRLFQQRSLRLNGRLRVR